MHGSTNSSVLKNYVLKLELDGPEFDVCKFIHRVNLKNSYLNFIFKDFIFGVFEVFVSSSNWKLTRMDGSADSSVLKSYALKLMLNQVTTNSPLVFLKLTILVGIVGFETIS